MAGNAVIGALRVVLGADTAALEKGLKDSQKSLGDFGATAGKVLAAAGAAMAAGLAGLGVAVRGQLKNFDDLAKTSQKIAVPVEQLSALRYAAELADVSNEALTKGLGKLARSVLDAAQGSTTAVAAYQALGLSFRDSNGQLKSVGDLLPEIADRFAAMKDGTAKTALAMQIFGKAGADLIPLLNGGSASIKELTEEAKALGLVISGDTAKTAEAFNDNMTRLGRVVTGVVTQFTANILPALAQLSQFLVDGAKSSGFLQTAVGALTTAFNGVARAAIILYDNIKPIGALFALWVGSGIIVSVGSAAISLGLAFVKLATATRVLGLTMAAFEAIRAISARGILLIAGIVAYAAGAFDNFTEKIKSLGSSIAQLLPEGAGEAAKQILKDLGVNLDGLTKDLESWKNEAGKKGGVFDPNIYKTAKDALDTFIASKQKQITVFEAEAAKIGQSNIEQEKAKFIAEGLAAAKEAHVAVTERLKNSLAALAEKWAIANERANFGKQIFEQTRTPAEQFAATMERLNLAFDYGKVNTDLYARGVAQAQQQFVQASPMAQAFGQSLESAFDKAIQGGAKFSDILRGLLSDLARAGANQIFKTLLYGGQGGTSSGILGSLFSSFKLPGFATGGTIMPGGSGAIDSQIVAFRKSPSEQVDIYTPGQQGAGAGGALTVRVVVNDEKFAAYVEDGAGRVVARSAPGIINAAVTHAVPAVSAARANNPGLFRGA